MIGTNPLTYDIVTVPNNADCWQRRCHDVPVGKLDFPHTAS